MVKLNPQELHLLALICANPDQPQSRELLNSLSPIAKAIAILILREVAPAKFVGVPLPAGMDRSTAKGQEVEKAAFEFRRLLHGRREEHAMRQIPA